ncbi:MAG: stage II sporulation protein R [Firmicutes bacterium]|nr:stage II sporulation protein R [Bacillota bacterium]
MKKIIFVFIGLVVLTVAAFSLLNTENKNCNEQFLRIHIRANSNEKEDQELKNKVKGKLIDFLTPYLAECDTKQKAVNKLNGFIKEIEKAATEEIKLNGFNYKAKARISKEEFPARSYDGFVLDAGFYDALIIEIGEGKGDNWWCVVYPPLCFINFESGQGVKYKSKILEIIENFGK